MSTRLPIQKNQYVLSYVSALRNNKVRKNYMTQNRFISCNGKKQGIAPMSWALFHRNLDGNTNIHKNKSSSLFLAAALTLAGSAIIWNHNVDPPFTSNEKLITPAALVESNDKEEDDDEITTLLNWSGTHKIELPNNVYHQPETTQELQSIIEKCYKSKTPIRPLGSALSPNGIGFHSFGMISLAYLDDIIEIDKENMTVTVQAGARVSQVIEALRPHNLTLPNLASIAEQQMGGFIQVGAHGTGALIPPVDEFVTKIKIISPTLGTLELEKNSNNAQDDFKSSLFPLAKVGLGCLGVVSEITMQCIPAHNLVEHTYVLTRSEAKKQINTLLKKHKHIRYMWIPYEDAVVVVTNDPEDVIQNNQPSLLSEATKKIQSTKEEQIAAKELQYKPLTDLLRELTSNPNYQGETYSEEMISGMGFGEIRDALLAINPLDPNHVKICNAAEATFWKNSEGVQIKPSDQLLQFDCGGQQWVWEVCFPTGTYETNNNNDMAFMENLLKGIEENQIAAHSPIEQRWSASSSSSMSPAHGSSEGLHCWVGIIMYLPSDQEKQRHEITDAFKGPYCDLLREVGKDVNATSHWAKLEMPRSEEALNELQTFMKQRFPVEKFNAARKLLDDENLLANDLMNAVFGSNKEEDNQ